MGIIKKAISNLIKESVKEAIREETATNFYAFWSLADSQNVDAENLLQAVRKNKRTLESEGKKTNAGLRPLLTEELSDKP